jgi:signal transduction histidine kinase
MNASVLRVSYTTSSDNISSPSCLAWDAADKAWTRNGGVSETVGELKTITLAMSREVRQLSWELRPTALDDLGLEPAIAN